MDPQRSLPRAAGFQHSRGTRRLTVESLEDRRMLATFSVTNISDSGLGSLRQAMQDANNLAGADTVAFDSSVFSSAQTINLLSALPTITEDIIIAGTGSDRVTINAGYGSDNLPGTGDGFRLFNIDDNNSGSLLNVAIAGLTLTGGDVSGPGGAIQSRESLTITDLAIIANATGPGTPGTIGGPGQDGGDGGRSGDGGGIFSSGGDLTILGSTVSGNSTGNGGAGGAGGDGADGTNGDNGGDGGNGGSGGYGGGIFTDGGNLIITNSTISGNSTGNGGASGNGGHGGEGEFGGTSGFGGNGGDGGYGGNGGGIYSSVGELTITGSTISGNSTGAGRAGGEGGEGGFGAVGGSGGDGGNGGSGGGLYSVEGRLEISMSTVTQNRAAGGGTGGANGLGGFVGNAGTAGNGGGIDSLGNDPFLMDNTIIAANLADGSAADLVTGTVTLNIEYSLIGNGDGLNINSSVGNQIGTGAALINPLLGPLTANGGKTKTHALLPNSPAIDAGDPAILPNAGEYDQRDLPFLRVEDGDLVVGSVIDIGAYEAQAPPSADFDQDGDVDGSDFLAWQRGFGTITGALLADGNSDDDEDVDASDLAVWTATYGQPASPLQAQRATASAIPSAAAAETEPSVIDLAVAMLYASDSLVSDSSEVGPKPLASVATDAAVVENRQSDPAATIAAANASDDGSNSNTSQTTADTEESSSLDVEINDDLFAEQF